MDMAYVAPKLRSCCVDCHPAWTEGRLTGYGTMGLSGLGGWDGVAVGEQGMPKGVTCEEVAVRLMSWEARHTVRMSETPPSWRLCDFLLLTAFSHLLGLP